jgi:hypothetical protein
MINRPHSYTYIVDTVVELCTLFEHRHYLR